MDEPLYETAREWLRTPPDSPYTLLLAELMAVKAELAALRERMDELDDELHETWMGGNGLGNEQDKLDFATIQY